MTALGSGAAASRRSAAAYPGAAREPAVDDQFGPHRPAEIAHRAAEARVALVREVEVQRRLHVGDVAVAAARELLHREHRAGLVVEVEPGEVRAVGRAAVGHERDACLAQVVDAGVDDVGAGDDHAIDAPALHEPLVGAQLRVLAPPRRAAGPCGRPRAGRRCLARSAGNAGRRGRWRPAGRRCPPRRPGRARGAAPRGWAGSRVRWPCARHAGAWPRSRPCSRSARGSPSSATGRGGRTVASGRSTRRADR